MQYSLSLDVIRPVRTPLLVAIACAALAALPLTGCASTETAQESSTTTTSTRSEQDRRAGDDTAATGETDTSTTDQTAPGSTGTQPEATQKLSDEQILGVVKVANESEVAAGQLAVQKAMTPEVRNFAQDMVQDHLAAGQMIDQTATAAPPTNSAMASTLTREANQEIESLNAQSGTEFDRAYMESQVKMHQDLLDTIKSDLLPQAQSAGVRQLLESMRNKVGEHLQEARELQQQMASIAG